MPTATEVTDIDLAAWGPGVKFYSASDGKHFVIHADLADYSHLPDNIVRQPTTLLYTDENGRPEDLTVDHTSPPGTTHEDALAEAGYTLETE